MIPLRTILKYTLALPFVVAVQAWYLLVAAVKKLLGRA